MWGMRFASLAYPHVHHYPATATSLLKSSANIAFLQRKALAKELQASLKKLDQEDPAGPYEKPQWKGLLK